MRAPRDAFLSHHSARVGRTSQPSATRCPTPLEASTCCRFRTRTRFPQNVFRRITSREIALEANASEIGLTSSTPHTYLMRPPSPVTSMSWKLPSHETAPAGSHRQRAVLGISDRRLQPTLFKDEHPRSGRSLALLCRLRGMLTSESKASRPRLASADRASARWRCLPTVLPFDQTSDAPVVPENLPPSLSLDEMSCSPRLASHRRVNVLWFYQPRAPSIGEPEPAYELASDFCDTTRPADTTANL